MKKKTVVTILTLALSAMVFAGCGSSQESAAAAASYEESTGPAVYADEVGEEPAEIAEPDDVSKGLTDVTGENDDFGRPPEDECAEWEEDDGIEEEVVVAETGEIEGIIVVQNYFTMQTMELVIFLYTLCRLLIQIPANPPKLRNSLSEGHIM